MSDPDVLRADGFHRVFANALDTLQFDFEKPIDVEELVDRIEDDPPPGVKVRVASDGSACDVTVQGFAGRIHVEPASLRVEGPPGLSRTPSSSNSSRSSGGSAGGRVCPHSAGDPPWRVAAPFATPPVNSPGVRPSPRSAGVGVY